VTVIIKDAKEEAYSKSQVFLKSMYKQITVKFNKELAKALNKEFASLFRSLKEIKEKRHRSTLGGVLSVF